jgi:hypothetical protein
MTYLEAINTLHHRASRLPGQSDPLTRAILPPVPLEWATPAELHEWREMVIALTSAPFLPADHPIPYAVRSYVRAVADTLAPAAVTP